MSWQHHTIIYRYSYIIFFQQLLPPLLVTTMAHSLDYHTDVTAYPQCGAIPVADHMSVTISTVWCHPCGRPHVCHYISTEWRHPCGRPHVCHCISTMWCHPCGRPHVCHYISTEWRHPCGRPHVSQTVLFGIDVSSLLVVWYSLFYTGTAVGGHSARPCFVITRCLRIWRAESII